MSNDTNGKPPPKYSVSLSPLAPETLGLDESVTSDVMDLWQVLKCTSTDAAQFEDGKGSVFSFIQECPYFATVWAKEVLVPAPAWGDEQRCGWENRDDFATRSFASDTTRNVLLDVNQAPNQTHLPVGLADSRPLSAYDEAMQARTRPLTFHPRYRPSSTLTPRRGYHADGDDDSFTATGTHVWSDPLGVEFSGGASGAQGCNTHLPPASLTAQASHDETPTAEDDIWVPYTTTQNAMEQPQPSGTTTARTSNTHVQANVRGIYHEYARMETEGAPMQVVEDSAGPSDQRPMLRVMNPDRDQDEDMSPGWQDGVTHQHDPSWNQDFSDPDSWVGYATSMMNRTASQITSSRRFAVPRPSYHEEDSDVHSHNATSNRSDLHSPHVSQTQTSDKNFMIGFIYLNASPADMLSSSLNLGIVLKQKWRAKGLGQKAVELVLAKVFEELQMHRLQVGILDSEVGMIGLEVGSGKGKAGGNGKDGMSETEALSKWHAQKLFTKLGFTHEGVRRLSVKHPVSGTWIDSTHMSILDTDWFCREHLKLLSVDEPRTVWTEMLQRHDRERTEMLRQDNMGKKLKRTGSSETIKAAAAAPTSQAVPNPSRYQSIYRSAPAGPLESVPTAGTPSSSDVSDYESASESIHSSSEASDDDGDEVSEDEFAQSRPEADALIQRFGSLLEKNEASLLRDPNLHLRNTDPLISSPRSAKSSSSTQSLGARSRAHFSLDRSQSPRSVTDTDDSDSEFDYLLSVTARSDSSPSGSKRRRVSDEGASVRGDDAASSIAGPSGTRRFSPSPTPVPTSPPRSEMDSESEADSRASWEQLEYASDVETVSSGIESASSVASHDEDMF